MIGKIKAMAVTGFVPNAFPAKHLSESQCRDYGNRLKNVLGDKICAFDNNFTLEECWAYPLLRDNRDLLPSDINPPKDRYAEPKHAAISNIILLQRYEWMRIAKEQHPEVDVFAWIEYTVLKQRNVTEQVLSNFITTIESNYYDSISLPGMWEKKPVDDRFAHWRFAGSAWVCPAKYIDNLARSIKTIATLRTELTGKISWDMNTMAFVELLDILPIRWYYGNHDETQFTNF